MWALRSADPPQPSLLALPEPLSSHRAPLPPQLPPLLPPPAPLSPPPAPSAAVHAELARLVQLSDVGSLIAERVALRARVHELEGAASASHTRAATHEARAAALAHRLDSQHGEAQCLQGALAASQRAASAAQAAATSAAADAAAARARGEDAERRAWQLQALMASQASAAAGVVTDWAGGADRSRGARLAFYNEQLAEAQTRAEAAEGALAAASAAAEQRLANETLALRAAGEAAAATASGRLAGLALQLRSEQERGEELAARLARCEEALRAALRRADAAEADAAAARADESALHAELARLRALAATLQAPEAVAASLSAQRAQLRSDADAELARVREGYEARLHEALAREREARARAEELERAAPLQQQLLAAPPAAAAPAAPLAFVEPAVHASVDNPLLPKGFRSIASFVTHLRSPAVGMRASQLVIFLDCTKSNAMNSNASYARKDGTFRSLHDVEDAYDPNPYHRVIRVLGRQLEEFDDDKQIPLYGFGDKYTKDKAVFPYSRYADIDRAYKAGKGGEAELAALLASDADASAGIDGVLALYTATQRSVQLQGPTSFAPAIEKTIAIVEATGEFTICLIIADGCIDTPSALKASQAAVVRASKYPISIIAVGVGDGEPGRSESERWEQMNNFDETISGRDFDNFHFVEHKCVWAGGPRAPLCFHSFSHASHTPTHTHAPLRSLVRVVSRETKIPEDECFALMALSEVPEQYQDCVKSGRIKGSGGGGE